MNKNFLIAVLVAILVIAIGAYWFPTQIEEGFGGGTRFVKGLSTDTTSPSAGEVRTTTLTVTGASSFTATTTTGSAGTVTYETKGGVSFAYFKVPFVTTATSTPCSIKNPFGASTSTLLQHNVEITNGTSTAGLIFTTASSTTYTATTTKLYTSGTFNVAAATSPSFTISPSNVNAAEIIPDAFITTWVEGYKASGFVYGGYCSGVVSKP